MDLSRLTIADRKVGAREWQLEILKKQVAEKRAELIKLENELLDLEVETHEAIREAQEIAAEIRSQVTSFEADDFKA